MTIIVKNISPKYGGNIGNDYNDYNDIIMTYGCATNIKSITIKKIEIQSGGFVDNLQFTYNIVTLDGASHDYKGNKYGGNGGTKHDLIFNDDEQPTRISGKYGDYIGSIVIKYLEIQTSQKTYTFGDRVNRIEDTAFNLPVGVIYGSCGGFLESIGSIMIAEAIQPTATATVTATVTPAQPTITGLQQPLLD
ncbi:hypothetical protein C1645_741534 [Glomus cerebriforme]|uniref:Jacalin-type lectin domain-containing protein n=1 Tax=Glomus cerebriforme TaxID=658196 RepID=A0A397SKS4_9GLOM|nr:hypothetical protein C1645_741534 [Glomus cerebriforme]